MFWTKVSRFGDSMLFYENKCFIRIRDPLMFILVNVEEKENLTKKRGA